MIKEKVNLKKEAGRSRSDQLQSAVKRGKTEDW